MRKWLGVCLVFGLEWDVLADDFDLIAKFCSVSRPECELHVAAGIHHLSGARTDLPPWLELSFERCRALIFEVSVEKQSLEEAAQRVERAAALPHGESLAEWISPQTMRLLRKEVSAPPNHAPWFVALSIRQARAQGSGGFSLEQTLARRAAEAGKVISALEYPGEMVEPFSRLGKKEQDGLLRQTLKLNPEWEQERIRQLEEAWRNGESKSFERSLAKLTNGLPDALIQVARDRERIWVPRILELLDRHERVLVIVGAAHLQGEGNLLQLLSATGVVESVPRSDHAEP